MDKPENQPNKSQQVRIARAIDRGFVLDLAKKNSDAVGFLPNEAIDRYIEWHLVTLAIENGQPAGYLLGKHAVPDQPGTTAIHQACVCYDLRRRDIGLKLVKRVTTTAAAQGNGLVQLWCRGDLEANEFWSAAGFTAVGIRAGGKSRKIPHILWRFACITRARIDAMPSMRRRGEAGQPIMIPLGSSDRDIMDHAKAGKLDLLLNDWTQISEQISQPCNIKTPADCLDAAEIEALTTPAVIEAPKGWTMEALHAHRATISRSRAPISRLHAA